MDAPSSTSPTSDIRVLLIEDSPDDAAMVLAALDGDAVGRFSIVHVGTLMKGLEHLASEPVDIVLVDLGLPDSQGIETVHRVLRQPYRVPVVVLTGLDDESIGMLAVQLGVQDHLNKKHVRVQLPHSIRYAIERQRAEEALLESEQNYREIFESAGDALILHNEKAEIIDVNERFCEMFGYDYDAAVSLAVSDVSFDPPAVSQAATVAAIRRAIEEGPQCVEWRCRRRDGELFWAEVGLHAYKTGGHWRVIAAVRDISARKDGELRLLNAKKELYEVIDGSPIASFVIDKNHRVAYWNKALEALCGIPAGEVVGTCGQWRAFYREQRPCLADLLLDQDHEAIDRLYAGKRQTSKTQEDLLEVTDYFPFEERRQRGRWLRFSASILRDTEGGVIGAVEVLQDITEHKQEEIRVHALNSLMVGLIRPSPIAERLKDITNALVAAVDADFARVWLMRPGDWCRVGCPYAEPADPANACGSHEQCLHLAASSGRYTHVNGKEHRRIPLDRLQIGCIASGEEACFLTNDVQHDPRIRNSAWAKELGLVGFAGRRLVSAEGQAIGVLAMFTRHPITREEAAYLETMAQITSQVIQTAAVEEALQHSERMMRRACADLERANVDLQRADQVKSQFLAVMSHEIRTPLNAVIGVTGLLLDTPLAGVQREYCDAIRISSDMLLTLINDILDFSKIEAGRMELESQPFELGDCIEEAVDLVATAAVNKGLRVSCDVAEGLPEVFVGDVMRLRQVLVNLLGNAVKFTDAGDVSIAVSGMPSGPNLYQLHFVVHDTGVGIPPEDQSQLFNSFTQVDSSTTRRFGGTGLGLAISKRIVELMGGTIWVESDGVPGEGASFHFTIRAERAAEDRLPDWGRAELEELAGKTVLIVDDNETNAHLIGVRAAQWKMIPTTVASAEEAIRTLGDGRCFDVAIVGLNMPNMDGLGVAKSIQAMPSAKDMPLVLISSSVVTARELEKAGYAAKVLKPVSKQRLCNALRTAIGSPKRSDAAGRPAVGGSRRGLRVLLVEDNPIGQKVAANMIEKLGHRTDVVSNGLEAVRVIQDIPYDVVFMDCQMPEMDGYEATRRIRESERSRRQAHIPIIAMTAHALEGDRERCLAAGMDDYLSKPVKLSQLQQLLDGLSRQSPPGLPLAAVPPADSFMMHEVVQP